MDVYCKRCGEPFELLGITDDFTDEEKNASGPGKVARPAMASRRRTSGLSGPSYRKRWKVSWATTMTAWLPRWRTPKPCSEMNLMNDQERAEYLVKLLKPCLKRSRNPDWSTPRYITEWGSKTEEGLKAIITRVTSGDDLPAVKE